MVVLFNQYFRSLLDVVEHYLHQITLMAMVSSSQVHASIRNLGTSLPRNDWIEKKCLDNLSASLAQSWTEITETVHLLTCDDSASVQLNHSSGVEYKTASIVSTWRLLRWRMP